MVTGLIMSKKIWPLICASILSLSYCKNTSEEATAAVLQQSKHLNKDSSVIADAHNSSGNSSGHKQPDDILQVTSLNDLKKDPFPFILSIVKSVLTSAGFVSVLHNQQIEDLSTSVAKYICEHKRTQQFINSLSMSRNILPDEILTIISPKISSKVKVYTNNDIKSSTGTDFAMSIPISLLSLDNAKSVDVVVDAIVSFADFIKDCLREVVDNMFRYVKLTYPLKSKLAVRENEGDLYEIHSDTVQTKTHHLNRFQRQQIAKIIGKQEATFNSFKATHPNVADTIVDICSGLDSDQVIKMAESVTSAYLFSGQKLQTAAAISQYNKSYQEAKSRIASLVNFDIGFGVDSSDDGHQKKIQIPGQPTKIHGNHAYFTTGISVNLNPFKLVYVKSIIANARSICDASIHKAKLADVSNNANFVSSILSVQDQVDSARILDLMSRESKLEMQTPSQKNQSQVIKDNAKIDADSEESKINALDEACRAATLISDHNTHAACYDCFKSIIGGNIYKK